MKLFENGVGRPTNEILRKRKIFIASVIILCAALVSIFVFTLTKVNTNSMKGAAATLKKEDVSYDFNITNAWWSGPGSDVKKFNIHYNEKPSASKISWVTCSNLEGCKSNKAYKNANSTNRKANVSVNAQDYTAKIKGTNTDKIQTTFYLRVTTYNSSTWLAVDVYEVKIGSPSRDCGVGTCYPVTKTWKWGKTNPTYVIQEMELSCQASRHYKNALPCTLKDSGGKAVSDITLSSTNADDESKKYDSYKTSGYPKIKGKEISVKYNNGLFTTNDGDIKEDDTGQYIEIKLTAFKAGWTTTSDTFKIYYTTNSTTTTTKAASLVLDCPETAMVNEKFKCTTNQAGVKITVGGAKALASGYKSTFNTTSSDKSKDIKYTNKLFGGTWTIKTDDAGNEYVVARVIASKKGNNDVKEYVKIYKDALPIELKCPETAMVNEKFKCTTNQAGVKITVGGANALASGYKSTFNTTSSDKSKDIKYTNKLFGGTWTIKTDDAGDRYVVARVIASKSGQSSIVKYIHIYE